jgi:hypothetical protein
MNIKFDSFCGQPIEVNSDASGQKFNCPSCGTSLTVPTVKGMLPTPIPQPPVIPQPVPIAVPQYNNHQKSQSIGWDVFYGLFGFFLIFSSVCLVGLFIVDEWNYSSFQPTQQEIKNLEREKAALQFVADFNRLDYQHMQLWATRRVYSRAGNTDMANKTQDEMDVILKQMGTLLQSSSLRGLSEFQMDCIKSQLKALEVRQQFP